MKVPGSGRFPKFDSELSKTTKAAVTVPRALEVIPTGGPRLYDTSFIPSSLVY